MDTVKRPTNTEEIDRALDRTIEAYSEKRNRKPYYKPPKKKMDPLIKITVVTILLIIGTWAVVAVSWLLFREYPEGLVTFTQWLVGLVFGQSLCYCAKECVQGMKGNNKM